MSRQRIVRNLVMSSLIFVAAAAAHAAPLQSIRTTDQGIHTIRTAGGKLTVVAATYQDAQVYKRSFSLFFQDGKENELQLVPIMESKVDHPTQWMHISRGETTIEDAAVVPRGTKVYLVVVSKPDDKPAFEVVRYVFKVDAGDYPDGPFYLFAPESSTTLRGTKSDSVETILDREIARVR